MSRKQIPQIVRMAALSMTVLCVLGALSACYGTNQSETVTDGSVDTPPYSAATTPLQPEDTDVASPSLTPRALTPIDSYVARLTDAFATVTPVPEAEVTYTLEESGAVVTGYTGTATVVMLPDTLGGRPVIAIAEGAFRDMVQLQALCLPDSVSRIGLGALEGCKGLATLKTPVFTCGEAYPWFGALFGATSYEINASKVPSTLSTLVLTRATDLPEGCFYGLNGLEVVGLPVGVTQIGEFAFYGCERLVYAALPEGLVHIGAYAFAHDSSLLRLTVPATVETLGASLLEGCGHLEELTLPFVGGSRTADTFLGYLFGARTHTFTEGFIPASLIRVVLWEGCTEIPANAFRDCSRLQEVVLPESVTRVGHRAFYRCVSLTCMQLPAAVSAIGDEAFKGCTALTKVDVSACTAVNQLGVQCFMNCTGLVEVTLSPQLTTLPDGMFAGCRSLVTVHGAGELDLSGSAFYGCPCAQAQEQTS